MSSRSDRDPVASERQRLSATCHSSWGFDEDEADLPILPDKVGWLNSKVLKTRVAHALADHLQRLDRSTQTHTTG